MSDRTKTPPETPTARLRIETREQARAAFGPGSWLENVPLPIELIPAGEIVGIQAPTSHYGRAPSTGHVFNFVQSSQGAGAGACGCQPGMHADHESAAALVSVQQATPHEAHYHTFEFRDSTAKLVKHPPDWFDGNPKPCPGSGQAPGVQFHGEVCDDGERKYLCRCPWCDKPQRPGPMPDHTFIPVRAEDITFATGRIMEGIEPGLPPFTLTDNEGTVTLLDKCDGEHPAPPCRDAECYHVAPPVGQATVLTRFIGPQAELLCECCELPLGLEPLTLVEITDEDSPAGDEDSAEFHVWHLTCARDHAKASAT